MRAHDRNWRRGWYNHRRWHRIRRHQFNRQPLCETCLAAGRVTPAQVVHHVEDHRGDKAKFFLGELRSLCRASHETIHQRAPRPWIGPDGWPLSEAEQARLKIERSIKREDDDDDDDAGRRLVQPDRTHDS